MQVKLDGGASFAGGKRGRRRTLLWRRWGAGPAALWLCLNPSTAGAKEEDPSTRKIRGFTERIGYEAYALMNLFDICATDPRELHRRAASQGALCLPDNFARILATARHAPIVMCAWGRHGRLQAQARRLLIMLRERGLQKKLHYLRLNVDGSPAHPLMLPYGLEPKLYLENHP